MYSPSDLRTAIALLRIARDALLGVDRLIGDSVPSDELDEALLHTITMIERVKGLQ